MHDSSPSEKSTRKLWIFDLDGTLLDSIIVFNRFFTKTVPDEFGKTLSKEHQVELEEQMLGMVSGKSSKWMMIKIFWLYSKKLGLSLKERFRMLDFSKRELNNELKNVPLFPEILESLRKLKEQGDSLAINTSSSREEIDIKLAGKDEFLSFFNGNIITRSDLEQLKPDPESVIKASQHVNIPLNRCIMVGDMPADIIAAQKAGAVSIAVLCGIFNRESIQNLNLAPDFIFQDVSEVVAHRYEIETFIYQRNIE